MENEESRLPVQVVRCEKHGLRYNAATQSGCVRCRRETGEASGARQRTETANPPVPLAAALAFTALLLFGTSLTFYHLHTLAYEATREHREALAPILDEDYEAKQEEAFRENMRTSRERLDEEYRARRAP